MNNKQRLYTLGPLLKSEAISETTNKTKKMKNKILAISTAPAAIPPNPKIAAMIAMMKKITAYRSIKSPPLRIVKDD
jgi:hypothetical protein